MIDKLKLGELIALFIGAGAIAFLLSLINGYGTSLVKKWQWQRNNVDRRDEIDYRFGIRDANVIQSIKGLETKVDERSNKYLPMIEQHEVRLIKLEVQYTTIIEILNEIKVKISDNGKK